MSITEGENSPTYSIYNISGNYIKSYITACLSIKSLTNTKIFNFYCKNVEHLMHDYQSEDTKYHSGCIYLEKLEVFIHFHQFIYKTKKANEFYWYGMFEYNNEF